MNYKEKFLEMSRNNAVVLERCKILINSLTQPAPVTKFNHLDSTRKIGKNNKANDKLEKKPEANKFIYLENDKSNKLNKLDTAPKAYKVKNCKLNDEEALDTDPFDPMASEKCKFIEKDDNETCKLEIETIDWDNNGTKTIDPKIKETSDHGDGISCKECGKLYMGSRKVFSI